MLVGRAHQNQYVNVAETLREAMTKDPHLQVFVASGYSDLATPYSATQTTSSHLGIDPSRQENISMSTYSAGHVMYVHVSSPAQLKDDLAQFVRSAVPDMLEP